MTGGPAVVGGVPVLVDGRAVSHPTASGRGIGRWVTTLVRSLIVVGERPVVMADGHRGVEQWHDLIDGVDVRPLDRALVREVLEEIDNAREILGFHVDAAYDKVADKVAPNAEDVRTARCIPGSVRASRES